MGCDGLAFLRLDPVSPHLRNRPLTPSLTSQRSRRLPKDPRSRCSGAVHGRRDDSLRCSSGARPALDERYTPVCRRKSLGPGTPRPLTLARGRNFYYDELTRSSRTSFPPLASLPFTGLLVRTFRRAHPLAARHRGRMATARLFHTFRACEPRADLAVVAGLLVDNVEQHRVHWRLRACAEPRVVSAAGRTGVNGSGWRSQTGVHV